MPNTNISPNMNLPIPIIGVDPGPDWASNLNASLTLIDQHSHSTGSGVQITPSGLNINSDLAMNGSNLTLVRTINFQAQINPITSSSPDLGCLYVAGVDLYYNDGSGNQVRITQGGNVLAGSGSITGLNAPATASYNGVSSTFVWQSAVNTAANMDFGSAIFRNLTANSNGITLSAPNSLSSNYTLTLPSLPATQNIMTLDNSGNITAPWNVDNATLVVSSNQLKVGPLGVQQANIYKKTTGTSVTAGNLAVSASSGSFSSGSGTPTQVTNLTVTLVTTGRPLIISYYPDQTGSGGAGFATNTGSGFVYLYKNGVQVNLFVVSSATSLPHFSFLDITATAGSNVYAIFAAGTGGNTISCSNIVLTAYEI